MASFAPDNQQFGGAFVKLRGDLSLADWFASANVRALNLLDVDLGSSGPMLLPGTDELVGAGKEGKLYVLQQGRLGGLQKGGWPHTTN